MYQAALLAALYLLAVARESINLHYMHCKQCAPCAEVAKANCRCIRDFSPPEWFEVMLSNQAVYPLTAKVEVFIFGLILADLSGAPRPYHPDSPEYAQYLGSSQYQVQVRNF